ncbi:flagellar motor switch protein G [Steroidobacter agaridevorans]|uniref:Flagellar motor switch protein FliG n=1 Tax=Steroidobacter agaridevorans TaxID=2695856 RepID=A0A829YP09_9GAMM|nr:flagellar motor switch protein FliG [Steroidobacter agaridevorans]GFE84398.1 flagellar motor switch protein G [Steroidobacter agaridevorans]GFE87218.1 flagellar motor switch protein G [Steroidobacter agaridevorans]
MSDASNAVAQVAASPLEQAAIVLLSMGEEPAAAVLRCLSREELLEVTQVMSRISGIKVEAVKTSLQRFFDEYRQQSGVHGASRSYLKRSLDLALGSDIADSVLNSIYGDAIRPKLARLQWASPKWLAERISLEHVRMQTVFLAFLPPALAGQVIGALPAGTRDLVLVNLARLNEVDHELLVELDELVERCLASLGLQSTSVAGVRQVAEILNRLPDNRAKMVEVLRSHDAEVVAEIERSMYDFFILSRQTEPTLLRIMEDVPVEQWAIALKGAEPAVRDSIIRAMPRRQAQSFEETMRRSGPLSRSRVEQARNEIMAQVKALADAGEIEVQLFAEAVLE